MIRTSVRWDLKWWAELSWLTSSFTRRLQIKVLLCHIYMEIWHFHLWVIFFLLVQHHWEEEMSWTRAHIDLFNKYRSLCKANCKNVLWSDETNTLYGTVCLYSVLPYCTVWYSVFSSIWHKSNKAFQEKNIMQTFKHDVLALVSCSRTNVQ